MDVAAALQLRIESVVLNQLRHAREAYGVSNLCLSGGVALNCSMNGRIEQEHIFDQIFVQPASGDAGAAIGSCYMATVKHLPEFRPKKELNFYLGTDFTDREVYEAFSSRAREPVQLDNLFEVVASRLADGKIIGWFQGRA